MDGWMDGWMDVKTIKEHIYFKRKIASFHADDYKVDKKYVENARRRFVNWTGGSHKSPKSYAISYFKYAYLSTLKHNPLEDCAC
jgi:hypothetical protein